MSKSYVELVNIKSLAVSAIKIAIVSYALAILIVFASRETIFGHDAMSMLEPIAIALFGLISLVLIVKFHFIKPSE